MLVLYERWTGVELSQMLSFLPFLIIKVQRDAEIKGNKFKTDKEKHIFMQRLFNL